MFHVALFEPEIPPNTGNVIRLCANTGAYLHLIEPMGFQLDDRRLRRAGLDHHEFVSVKVHGSFTDFICSIPDARLFALSTRGTRGYSAVPFQPGDAFLFGPETRGLPRGVLDGFPPDRVLRLPFLPRSRSLNLSNTVAITLYEAWRQLGFPGADGAE